MVKGSNVFINASNNNVIMVVIPEKHINICAIAELNNILKAP